MKLAKLQDKEPCSSILPQVIQHSLQNGAAQKRSFFGASNLQDSSQSESRAGNATGIPLQMKSFYELHSGLSLDDVHVHYHSDKPAQLQALAFAQGTDVYIAPGQERHLGHELGHVIQQKQGRVGTTGTINGISMNDSPALEAEADQFSRMTVQMQKINGSSSSSSVVQRTVIGSTVDSWCRDNKITKLGLKSDRLRQLYQDAHLSNLHFTKEELTSFMNGPLKDVQYHKMEDAQTLFYSFRRYVAKVRDAEGAHGHERHAGSGDDFIVHRANASGDKRGAAPNPPFSYLLMDEYLTWDTILYKARDKIFENYLALSTDIILDIRSDYGGALPDRVVSMKRATIASPSGEHLYMEVKTSTIRESFDAGIEHEIQIGADMEGLFNLHARSVTKPKGLAALNYDVQDIAKHPVAFTGGMAPWFGLDDKSQIVTTPEIDDLKWVTKY